MGYDVIVIGAGISGLTAAALLAKRGVKTAVVEKSHHPGGSCGIFKRDDITFDQGAAMLYGFGEEGFNPHRFIFNCLEEPIDVIKHDFLYCVNYMGKRIRFWPDIDRFVEELGQAFPSEKENIREFYEDLSRTYRHVMIENPVFSTPDEADRMKSLRGVIRHPVSYARFLSYLDKSTESLLRQYFKNPEIFKFFDKLTSTYCYTTVKETPAILAAIMFVDNHVGGSFYPAGSTLFLPGKLEKVIEENGGDMLMDREVAKILFDGGRPSGVETKNGERLYADNIIYSGTVWNLYGKLIDEEHTTEEKREWARSMVPTYPSVVLYAYVDRAVITADTLPVEMLVGNPDMIDESEVTAYILSIDDHTLCKEDGHVVVAIGPTFEKWESKDPAEYSRMKEKEKIRLTRVLEKRFPGITEAVRYSEVATPVTIERYTNKNGGAVAGPKQMLGQHMFHRQHTRTDWDSLFCCGESTVMGTGTPTVSISGLSAANAVLEKLGLEPFIYRPDRKNYVQIVEKPYEREMLYAGYPERIRKIMQKASRCQYCEHPTCTSSIDMSGLMRRVAVGNFTGAAKIAEGIREPKEAGDRLLEEYQGRCIRNDRGGKPVEIKDIITFLTGAGEEHGEGQGTRQEI